MTTSSNEWQPRKRAHTNERNDRDGDKQAKSILCMHHTITPVAFIELLMSFALCVFDINETDDNVDGIVVSERNRKGGTETERGRESARTQNETLELFENHSHIS